MINTLIVNADARKPRCSMYQGGLAVHEALKCSEIMDVSYVEASRDEDIPSHINAYDLVIFNYHPATMGAISSTILDAITTKKMAIIWDMMREPWAFSGVHNFDYVGIPDPVMVTDDPTVCILPRIIGEYDFPKRPSNIENPIISTFGFPAEYKDMLAIVEAINKEFDKATFRIKYAQGDHTPTSYTTFPFQVFDACKKIAKPGIDIILREDYLPMDKLVSWLNESDLNIFLYGPERDQDSEKRVPTSVDQAIASRRPLALSDSRCVDHVLGIFGMNGVGPYPKSSLQEIMRHPQVSERLAQMWRPAYFASIMDEFIGGKFAV